MGKCFENSVEHFGVETKEKTIYTLPTDQAELFKLLHNCSKSNVEGYDFMINQLLSIPSPVLAQPVTYLINRWLSESVFPNNFKTAKCFTFYKSGDVDAVQNYRPISILPSLRKVIEKVILTQFQHFLNTKHNFPKSKRFFGKKCR